ncbi:MAG: DUF2164 domain-containing protein [Candidatus Berkelbacteria bacterium]
MGKDRELKLPKEKRAQLIEEVKQFFLTERDEEIGDLAASAVLDFMLEKIGNELYNEGVKDSYSYINDKIIDVLGIQR